MWYRTGTVNLTNGSATVIGVGTAFVGAVQPGGVFVGPNAAVYEVLEVVSATQLTLRTPYLGSTTAGSAYGGIFPTYAALVKLTSDIALLLGEYAGVKDNAGAGKFGDGTAALPGVRFSADEDTGMRRTGANALALVTGGADRLAVTNAGATLTGLLTGTAVAQGSTDTTAGRLLTTGAGPAQAFRRGNILGPVSQSGGVPTGAIIERGINANGEFTRFAGGTQICHFIAAATFLDSTFLRYSWTFPAAFIVPPNLLPVMRRRDAANVTAGVSSSGAFYAYPNSVVSTNCDTLVAGAGFVSVDIMWLGLLAIGRWF